MMKITQQTLHKAYLRFQYLRRQWLACSNPDSPQATYLRMQKDSALAHFDSLRAEWMLQPEVTP
jgi:hypothetical protein